MTGTSDHHPRARAVWATPAMVASVPAPLVVFSRVPEPSETAGTDDQDDSEEDGGVE